MIFHQIHNSSSANHYNAFFYTHEEWEMHFHKNLEIIYVVKGIVNATVNQKEYVLGQGELALCLPYEIHSYHPQPDSLYWVCVFSEDHVRFFSKQMQGKTASTARFVCSEAVADYTERVLMNDPSPSIYIIKSCLYGLCAEFLRCVKVEDKDQGKSQPITDIISFVEAHHTENVTLADLAGLLGYDYHYTSRYFHSVFHMPFKDFLNIYRLETAVRLMDETERSLVEIAFESGFQSLRTFNHCFHKHFGLAPSQYRKTSRI